MSTRKHMVELVLTAAAQGLGLVIAVVASCAGTAPVEARTPVLHLVTEFAPVDELDDSIPAPELEPEPDQGQRLPDARILPPPDAAPMHDAAGPPPQPPSPPPPPPPDASPDAAPILPPRVRVDAAVFTPPRQR